MKVKKINTVQHNIYDVGDGFLIEIRQPDADRMRTAYISHKHYSLTMFIVSYQAKSDEEILDYVLDAIEQEKEQYLRDIEAMEEANWRYFEEHCEEDN